MNENTPVLIELALYKGDRRDQVLEYISLFHVIQGNLVSNESLWSIVNQRGDERPAVMRTSGTERLPLITVRIL